MSTLQLADREALLENDEEAMANHDERLAKIEVQIETIHNDISEMKRVRKEMNDVLTSTLEKIENKLDANHSSMWGHLRGQDKMLWIGLGVLLAAQVFIRLLVK